MRWLLGVCSIRDLAKKVMVIPIMNPPLWFLRIKKILLFRKYLTLVPMMYLQVHTTQTAQLRHTYTHTNTHARTHAHTHKHTHAHTHIDQHEGADSCVLLFNRPCNVWEALHVQNNTDIK